MIGPHLDDAEFEPVGGEHPVEDADPDDTADHHPTLDKLRLHLDDAYKGGSWSPA